MENYTEVIGFIIFGMFAVIAGSIQGYIGWFRPDILEKIIKEWDKKDWPYTHRHFIRRPGIIWSMKFGSLLLILLGLMFLTCYGLSLLSALIRG